jgi:hypothetical protein
MMNKSGKNTVKIVKAVVVAISLAGGLCDVAFAAQDTSAQPSLVDVAQGRVPVATLRLSAHALAAGIGVVWGSGQLDYEGAAHVVRVSGVSIVDVGAAKIDVDGKVYNLKNLADFEGQYDAFSVGATVAGGAGVVYLRNSKGVVIRLDTRTEGLRFNIAGAGIAMHLKS